MIIPRWVDGMLNVMSIILFPSRNHTTATIIIYTLVIGIGLWIWLGSWLWLPATVLSMIMAWMLTEWFF